MAPAAPTPATATSSAAQGPVAVHVARSDAELEAVRDFWERWKSHPTVEWHACHMLVRRSDGNARMLVLIHGDAATPRAGLVAIEQGTRVPITFGYWRIANPQLRVLTVKHGGGWLGPATDDSAGAILVALQREMRERGATVLHLEHFAVDHPLVRAATAAGATAVRAEPDLNWRVAIPDSHAAFLAACSKGTRRNLKRYPEKFLTEFGDRATIAVLQQPGDYARIVAEMNEVAQYSYLRNIGAGFLAAPEQLALIEAALAHGTYRAFVLSIDGKPAAYWDGRRCGGTFFTDFTAYLPKYREARPGWYLLSRVIEELCNDPLVDSIDFGQGDAQYKQMLGTVSSKETSLAMYAPTLRGRGLRVLVRATAGGTQLARRVLDRAGLTAKLKRLWRRRLSDDRSNDGPSGDDKEQST